MVGFVGVIVKIGRVSEDIEFQELYVVQLLFSFAVLNKIEINSYTNYHSKIMKFLLYFLFDILFE